MGKRVLVVDDDPDIRALVVMVLDGAGDEVRAVADPALVDGALADGWEPEVAVIDLMMPGLDGSQVAAVLRARFPGLRLIVYSARSGASALNVFSRDIADGVFVAKPFDIDTLADLVHR